ncbi:MAG: PAS domain S-box protein [Candidatus Omnitrophica bacterium]|nr:PAS domain S-box protein [Candidatus Omnitrophota bacterium]
MFPKWTIPKISFTRPPAHVFLPAVIFLIGILLTGFLFLFAEDNAARLMGNFFQRAANIRSEEVNDRFHEVALEFDSLKLLFAELGSVKESGFQRFVRPYLSHANDVLSAFWIARVPQDKRQEFEDLWSSQDRPFQIRDLISQNAAAVAPPGEMYYPLMLIEPVDARLLGADLGNDRGMRNLFNAIDSANGKPTVFPFTWPLGKEGRPYCFVSSTSVLKNELADVPGQVAFGGYLALVIDLDKILSSSLFDNFPNGMRAEFYDVSASPSSLLFYVHPSRRGAGGSFLDIFFPSVPPYGRVLYLGDRRFLFVVSATPEYFQSFYLPVYWFFWPLGVLLTFFFSFYTYRLLAERSLAEKAVSQKASDLIRNEQQLSTTLHSIGDGLITLDNDRLITRMNPVAEKQTGWRAQDAIGRPLGDVFRVIHEESREPLLNNIHGILKATEGVRSTDPVLLISRDGREVPISYNFSAILDENKRALGAVLVFHNITEERQASKALLDSEQKFRSFFINMNEGVALHRLVYGRNGLPVNYIITDVNPRYEQITGLSREQVIGKLATDVYKTPAPPYLEDYIKPLSTGQPWTFTTFFAPMKKHFHISVISYTPNTFTTVFSDITQEKLHEAQLQESREKIASILRGAPVGIVVIRNRVLIEMNEKFCETVGYTRDELAGKSTRMLYPSEEEYERVGRELYGELARQGGRSVEARVVRKNGQILTVLLNITPLDVSRPQEGAIFTILDITAMKQAEEAQKRERNVPKNTWISPGSCL